MSKVITDKKKINDLLTRGVENIYPDQKKLEELLLSGKQLRLYCGYDPTASSLHIGHGITIRKLAKFLELGHHVMFLFGDFTGTIGDPTDKSATRKPLTLEQVKDNLKGWKKQIQNIIDIHKVDFQFNSRWLKKLSLADAVNISSHFTVQQMLDRDMFDKRLKEGKPIHLHEFFYPLLQAYDSVAMDVDLEIGGNDQTFNMLAGRTLMKAVKSKEKMVLTTKLLEDPTGKKMGKSEGNMIRLDDRPEDMFGKVMSWPDEMIVPAFEILTDIEMDQVDEYAKQMKDSKFNPRDLKVALAHAVVSTFLGETQADLAQHDFERVFVEKKQPSDMPEVTVGEDMMGVLDLFVFTNLAPSNSQVRRLIKEGAIKINDQKVTNPELEVKIEDGMILQKGKKNFVKIKI